MDHQQFADVTCNLALVLTPNTGLVRYLQSDGINRRGRSISIVESDQTNCARRLGGGIFNTDCPLSDAIDEEASQSFLEVIVNKAID